MFLIQIRTNIACRNGHYEVATFMESKGANIFTKDMNNNTPIHNAVLANNHELVDFLIARKLDVNSLNFENMTPIK